MDHATKLKYRISSFYNWKQLALIIVAAALIFSTSLIFPGKFPFIHDSVLYLLCINLITIAWYVMLTIYITIQTKRPLSKEALQKVLRMEIVHSSLNLVLLGILMPLGNQSYFNPLWFLSIFFYLLVLGNPLVKPALARITIAAPVAGWLGHMLFHLVFSGSAPDLFSLPFCVALTILLLFSWNYFVRVHSTALMAGSRADGPDSRIEEFTDRYQLTPREQEVFLLVISGHITKQVAGMLGISYYTAVTHVKNIYKKTGASSKVELLSLLNRFTIVYD
jgi:DNA-binding CsgD family transcriptional regulator